MDVRSTPSVAPPAAGPGRGGRSWRIPARGGRLSCRATVAQVALAERQLGLTLFDRDRRQIRVTPAAEPVIAQARAVLLATNDLFDLARRRANPLDGTLRLGVIPTVAPSLLPRSCRPCPGRFPISPCSGPRRARPSSSTRLRPRRSMPRSSRSKPTSAISITRGGLGSVRARGGAHPLMRQDGPAAPDILSDEQVLLLDDGHCLRDQALAMCQRSGAREESFRATSLATLVQVVSGSQSVTLLPSLAVPVENRRAQIRTRPFAAPAPGRTVALAWRRRSPLGPALVAVARTCRAAIAPDHLSPGPADASSSSVRPSVTKARTRVARVTPRPRRTVTRSSR